eukprot:gene9375-9538_t
MLRAGGQLSAAVTSSFYQYVQSKVPQLQAAGITHLWLPPPSHSVSPEGYMPGQLYDLDSAYGTRQQLTELIADLKAAGICPMADVVINHSLAWGSWAIDGSDSEFGGAGSSDGEGERWVGAPNLDHSNPQVRAGLAAWLQWLQDSLGFEGWRFDFAKGYSSRYVQLYVDATVGGGALNVGELWVDLDWTGPGNSLNYNQDAARQELCDWVNGCGRRAGCFDFVTKGILQEALSRCELWRLKDAQGKAPGLIGWWPEQSITFVDNHDTGSSQKLWPFPAERLAAGYVYILTHPGTPCVFSEHYFDQPGLQDTVDALLQVRKRNEISSTSQLDIFCAEGDLYVACVGGRLLVKLGPRYDVGAHNMPTGHDWAQVICGPEFCVWEDKGQLPRA